MNVNAKRILVVDDSATARAMCGALLEEAGYEVAYASSALEGIQVAASRSFALILMDVIMPAMNGIEACGRMRADKKLDDVPIIMATAAEELEHLEKAFEAGAADYITKPIRKFELLARVKSALTLKARELELLHKNKELEIAFKEIKVLQGFIPVCAWCKKIRDMQGSWQQMEAYLEEHSSAQFSHSICQGCAKKQKASWEEK